MTRQLLKVEFRTLTPIVSRTLVDLLLENVDEGDLQHSFIKTRAALKSVVPKILILLRTRHSFVLEKLVYGCVSLGDYFFRCVLFKQVVENSGYEVSWPLFGLGLSTFVVFLHESASSVVLRIKYCKKHISAPY